ncbi:hypothetical protein Salat_1362300 [Sesamum alatum]|uniref:Uncharacterized protein n=1 Tax=Sesamum alatum TaxID=300844 RepID=A0AAE1YI00_9LAMI|nr:hypothetical protein Salat_1362300 [Sesamum alatum]
MAKTQITFSVLLCLVVFLIGDSLASPQMCNEFIGCTVNINVCKTKCTQKYGGRGMCVAAGPPAPPPAVLHPTRLQKPAKKCCHCKCLFRRKDQRCPTSPRSSTLAINA